jgi:hypothetical protein
MAAGLGMRMGKKLLAFNVYCGRMGSLSGRFVADDEDQAELESIMGRDIYFGEVLGKHSDVTITLEPEHISVVTDNEAFLAEAERLNISLDTGFDPLQQYRDSADDGMYDEEEDGEEGEDPENLEMA